MNVLAFYMMVGLPGSGKSTKAEQIKNEFGAKIFSSDSLRKEKFGDEKIQKDAQAIFKVLLNRCAAFLNAGHTTILDATNLSYKKRMTFLKELDRKVDLAFSKICILMATPYEICYERNRSRERVVPDEVMKHMYCSFYTPTYFEGWDDIQIIYPNERDKIEDLTNKYLASVVNFPQDNPHHKYPLYDHLFEARKYIEGHYNYLPKKEFLRLIIAANYHDIGKPATKFFKSNDSIAHYYNHENVGAYMILFIFRASSVESVLYISSLICYHMMPYVFEKSNEKTIERYKNLWGEEFYNDIMRLHEADVAAH